jgi:hypothetical protein
MARPKKPFDWSKLDAVLQYNATLADCAEIMGVHQDTVERKIKKEKGCCFTDYRQQKLGKVRIMLVQKAIEMARSGSPAMLIFCLKNLCGWSDRHEVEQTTESKITIDIQDGNL